MRLFHWAFVATFLAVGGMTPVAPARAGWHHGWYHRWHRHGWWHRWGPGVVVGPAYVPPPVYYAPPPAYYAPPPVYYAAPPAYYTPGVTIGVP